MATTGSAIARGRKAAGAGGLLIAEKIIFPDRYSRVHLVMAGRGRPDEPLDAAAIVGSPQLSIAIEALGRSYDHVVLDAGAAAEASLELLARLAPRAVLVAPELDNPETALAREQLLQAGFATVSVLVNASRGEDIGAAGGKAAA